MQGQCFASYLQYVYVYIYISDYICIISSVVYVCPSAQNPSFSQSLLRRVPCVKEPGSHLMRPSAPPDCSQAVVLAKDHLLSLLKLLLARGGVTPLLEALAKVALGAAWLGMGVEPLVAPAVPVEPLVVLVAPVAHVPG